METLKVRDRIAAIVAIFAEHTTSPENLTDSTNLVDDLGINSARFVDVVLELEERLHVVLGDEIFDSYHTFGMLVSAVQEQMTKDS